MSLSLNNMVKIIKYLIDCKLKLRNASFVTKSTTCIETEQAQLHLCSNFHTNKRMLRPFCLRIPDLEIIPAENYC